MRVERLLLVFFMLAAGCATVHRSSIRPDYATSDAAKAVRVAIVTAPLPDGNEAVGQLWGAITRKYIYDHRDFIPKASIAAATAPKDVCQAGTDGVMLLVPTVHKQGDSVEAAVVATLNRCGDNEVLWSADASGKWDSNDETLADTTRIFTEKFGDVVKPYVAPSYRLLRAVLDTLPKPMLDDAGQMEKIEAAE